MTSTDLLVKYYDAISKGDLDKIAECFDFPNKLISLYGVVNINSKDDLKKTYFDIFETWKGQGISNKIGYDRNELRVSSIQDNIVFTHAKLTNYDLDGNYSQEWNCNYILRKEEDSWLICLSTTNNKHSKSMK